VPGGLNAIASEALLRYDLKSFVILDCNRAAHATVMEVLAKPSEKHNPLFIFGNTGLGKTHLVQGLCREYAFMFPGKRWMYLPTLEFRCRYLDALKKRETERFFKIFEDLQLLVLDDVQDLQFHSPQAFSRVYSRLLATSRQLVLVSQLPPKCIADESLNPIEYFERGTVVRVDPLISIDCQALISAFMKQEAFELPQEVIDWLTARGFQDVREIQGTLSRLRIFAEITPWGVSLGPHPRPISLADVISLFPDKLRSTKISVAELLQAVSRFFGVETEVIKTSVRAHEVSLARSVLMFLLRKHVHISFPEIGVCLGNRNHSTIISACKRIQGMVDKLMFVRWKNTTGEHHQNINHVIELIEQKCCLKYWASSDRGLFYFLFSASMAT
jgi:chromosomal replication initiator protein